MLDFIGRGKSHNCNGRTRRDFLQVGTLGAAGLSLPQWLQAKDQGLVDAGRDNKSCILIFNLGAPSHIDTFDMKPEAPAEIRGPFKPVPTNVSGIQLSEILPKHAEIADKIGFVRSCFHRGAAVHDSGWQIMQTAHYVNFPRANNVALPLRGYYLRIGHCGSLMNH